MAARRRHRPALKEALQVGQDAWRSRYTAARDKYAPQERPRTFTQRLRRNALLLRMLGAAVAATAYGAWTVYTYYNPAPAAVVQPAAADPDPLRRPPVDSRDKAYEPREKPEDPFRPHIQLILFGAPLDNVPKPVQQSLEAAASIVLQTPEQQEQVENSLLQLLTNLNYIPRDVPSAIAWQDWHTIAVVPASENSANFRPRIPTLAPPARETSTRARVPQNDLTANRSSVRC